MMKMENHGITRLYGPFVRSNIFVTNMMEPGLNKKRKKKKKKKRKAKRTEKKGEKGAHVVPSIVSVQFGAQRTPK